MNSNTKIILLSIVRALWIFLSLVVVTVFIMSVAFPKNLADITYDLGMKQLSLVYYNSAYKSSDKIEDAYFMVNFSKQMQKNDLIEHYYNKLENHENYNEFIEQQKEKEIKLAHNIYDLSIVLNKKELLQTTYVSALIANNKFETAKQYSANVFINQLNNNALVVDYSFTLYLLFNEGDNQDIYNYIDELCEGNFVGYLVEYFNNNYNYIINNKDSESIVINARKISTYFRLNKTAFILEKVNTLLGDDSTIDLTEINTKLDMVADILHSTM